ncbi:MAG: dihydroneopterin aldolase [Prevotellaceae bacterium]|nr:dihydroneopterin aldolase [Prevotellaceae bacterium]
MNFCITIDRLKLHACHGVLPQERIVGADFYVTICAQVEVESSAWQDDCLEGTTNYADIVAIVRREMAIPSNLLEHVAARIASSILAECSAVSTVSVTLEKENPPLGVLCRRISVKIEQSR